MTTFKKHDTLVGHFLNLIDDFGKCSGLKINYDKPEILLFGNQVSMQSGNTTFKHISISIKLQWDLPYVTIYIT